MESIQQNEEILHKWDIILVEIFKKEWPNSWTSFVKDLVAAAVESESRCRNSMFILKIVVEDVFQFSETTLTSKFSQQIQQALQSDESIDLWEKDTCNYLDDTGSLEDTSWLMYETDQW